MTFYLHGDEHVRSIPEITSKLDYLHFANGGFRCYGKNYATNQEFASHVVGDSRIARAKRPKETP